MFLLSLAAASFGMTTPPGPTLHQPDEKALPLPSPTAQPGKPEQRARARADIAALLSSDDYPVEAIEAGQEGDVGFRLDVGPEGLVKGCTVTASSGSDALDSATCRLMSARARFIPAVDANGRPVSDTVSQRVRWRMPKVAQTAQTLFLKGVHNVWETTADGRQRSCRKEHHFLTGESLQVGDCQLLDASFVRAAAAYLQAAPDEVITIRLENHLTTDVSAPFPLPDERHGLLLARGEGSYHLDSALGVDSCVEDRMFARIRWQVAPCYRKSLETWLPLNERRVRLAVQYLVRRGPDLERPARLPTFIDSRGKTHQATFTGSKEGKSGEPGPTAEPAPKP